MIKLIRTNILRILKSPTYLICNGLYLVYGILLMSLLFNFESVYNLGFSGSPITSVVIAIFVSILIGTEYNNHTIRNKIIMGYTKTQIYMSNVIAYSLCAIIPNLIFLCISCLPEVLYGYAIGALFKVEIEFTTNILAQVIAVMLVENILSIIFCVSIYTLIAMNIKNAIASTICSLIISVLAVLVALAIIYAEGPVWYGLVFFFPSGINTLLADGNMITDCINAPYFAFIVAIIMIILTIVTTCIGVQIFKKSNIK